MYICMSKCKNFDVIDTFTCIETGDCVCNMVQYYGYYQDVASNYMYYLQA